MLVTRNDWILADPGGKVILRAAGGAIDRYWEIFTIHRKQEVYDILEEYRIGNLDPRDIGDTTAEDVDDPFSTDPDRDKRLQVLSSRPCNAETPEETLGTFLTPTETFYVRNHLWVPEIDANKHTLLIELHDSTEKEFSLADLKEKFPAVTITATLQCSGNRRKHMTEGSRSTNGLQWVVGAISTAKWTGARLRDVLANIGFPVDEWPDNIQHVQFIGAEAYGASIPVAKAVDKRDDVLIVYEMNGTCIPPDHGYPFRMLIPGNVAARSVKLVSKIVTSEEESTSQWQRRDYKCFGPNQGSDPNWNSAPVIQEMPVQSAITKIQELRHIRNDIADCSRRIVRVDISTDNGHTWRQAELLDDTTCGHGSWAWKQWRFVIPKQQASRVFVVKAVDEAYNTQPDSFEAQYNFRGNLTSGWHRVPFKSD